MTETIKLDGNIRENLGGNSAKKLRQQNRIPAVIYTGEKENVFIDLETKYFEKEFFKGAIETKIFEIKTPKKVYRTVLYQIEINAVSDRPEHIDFLSIENKNTVKILVPVKFLNKEKSPGLKRNGFLNILKRKISLICDVKNIPKCVEIDISNLRLKQSIKSDAITLPKDCTFFNKKPFMIANIIGRGKDEEENKVSAATATTTAVTAPATPTKAVSANKK